MITLSRNKLLLLIFLCSALLLSFYIFNNDKRNINPRSKEPESLPIRSLLNNSEESLENESTSELKTEEPTLKLVDYDDDWCFSTELNSDSRDLASTEYEQWAVARNHLDEVRAEQVNRYNDYQPQTLKLLAEQGDLLALTALVLNPNTPEDRRNWAARQAAVYGGTGSAMSHISTSLKGKSAMQMSQNKKEDAKKSFLESVAWDEFAIMRGDRLLLDTIPFTLSLDGMHEMEITKEDETWISNRAHQIYAELTQERILKGLGDFDNSIPKVVKIESVAAAAYNIGKNSQNSWYSKYFPSSECVERYLE